MNNNDTDYKIHEFVAHNTAVTCLTFGSRSAQVVASGGEDCKVHVWRVDNTANIWSLGHNKYPIECLNFDAEEQYLVSGSRNGSIKVFDLNVGKLARNLPGHPSGVTSVNYHPYGEFIVSGGVDNTMKVWDIRSKMCIQTYTGHEKAVTCVRFSPDGRWVASSGKDGQFLVWDLVAGKLVQSIKTRNNYLNSFEFNPAEFLLAGASSDKTVKFWDLETFERVGRTPPSKQSVSAVTFNQDGTSLCAASNGMLRVWGWEPSIESKLMLTSVDWENVYEMRIAPNTNQLIAGSYISNFVSLYSIDLDELLEVKDDDEDNEGDDSIEEQTQIQVDQTPEKRDESSAKEIPDEESPGDKWEDDDYENDFEEDVKLEQLDIGEEKDSKGSSGPGVEWDSGITPRDLATSMGESFLAKLKEDERKARNNDGLNSPRVRPPSTAQRRRNAPKRPPMTFDSPKSESKRPGTNASVRKPVSYYNGIESRGNGQGGSDIDGLEIVGSKHAARDNSGSSSFSVQGTGNIGVGGYRYAVENSDSGPLQNASVRRSNDSVMSGGGENGRERNKLGEKRGVSPRGRIVEDKRESTPSSSHKPSYMQPTESSSIPKDKDTAEVLDNLVNQSAEVMSTLSQRLTNLRLLNQYWERGDMSIIIDHMKTIQLSGKLDPNGCVVLADFFSSVDLKASNVISLEVCGKLLPVLDGMLDIDLEEVSMASLIAVISLAESYGPLIADTRGVVVRQVDISREERLEKCNSCHRAFSIILDKCDSLKQQHRKNALFRDVIERAQSALLSFV